LQAADSREKKKSQNRVERSAGFIGFITLLFPFQAREAGFSCYMVLL
jgi:hypothetical protein